MAEPHFVDAVGRATGKRWPLNMRTTSSVRFLLEEAAQLSGRSLAAEVETRIQQSLVDELHQGGIRKAKLARAVAAAMDLAGCSAKRRADGGGTGDDWLDDAAAYDAAVRAAVATLEALRPRPLASQEDQE